MASYDNDEERYWTDSKSNVFDFFEEESDFVSIEKIESEKQFQLRATSPSKPSSQSQPSFKSVLTNIFVQREKVQSYANYFPQIEQPTYQKRSSETIVETVRKLVLGVPATLETLKSLTEKLELLDEALRWHDGNAIFTVLSFLKRTLKPSIFNQEIIRRPDALNHYLKLLNLHQNFQELGDVLAMLGRNEDAAIILYKCIVSSNASTETKLKKLKTFQSNHLRPSPDINFIGAFIQEQIKLFEHQLPIEESDAKQESENRNLIFLEFPRQSLPGSSVMTTLHYCCLYHYHLPENNLTSPLLVKKLYNLTDKQFAWVALQALILNKLWKDIELLFQTKSWMKGTKMTCCIGFDKVVKLLHKASAPVEEVTKYFHFLDSTQRLQLARKYKYSQIVVDTLVALRDRLELQAYSKQLVPNSREHLYATESLKASSIKWKN